MNIYLPKFIGRLVLPTLGIGLCALLAIGCASAPPQALTTQLAQTDTSIAQAEQSGAAQGGMAELQQAKDKRANAQAAFTDKKYQQSMELAQQAQVDAQLASNKARAKAAEHSAAEVSHGTEALRDESLRSGDKAAEEAARNSNQ